MADASACRIGHDGYDGQRTGLAPGIKGSLRRGFARP